VKLLHGFESRMRGSVVRTLLDHWTVLSEADYETALEALTENRIEDSALRHRAVNQLEAGLGGAHDLKIRRALNRLLED
jgi:hypothetical protein